MMSKEQKEVRTISNSELRLADDSRRIEGYGIIFNSISKDLGGFKEIIKPEAMDGVIERSDVFALLNHNEGRGILARSDRGEGSLKLEVDSKGLKYSFDAPKTNLAEELVEGIRRKDIKASSFAFSVDPKGETVERLEDGTILRTVTKFNLIYDVSPAYRAAYDDTTVAMRSLDSFKSTEQSDDPSKSNPSIEEPTGEEIEKKDEKIEMSDRERYLRDKQMHERRKLISGK